MRFLATRRARNIIRTRIGGAVGLALLLAACGGGGSASPTTTRTESTDSTRPTGSTGPGEPADERPNVVVIMTDDQTVADLEVMEATHRLIGDAGTTFADNIASYPLCCPSRATFLTGQYAHNHGVVSNKLPAGGYTRLDHEDTLAVWLEEAGYVTAHLGKYLNGYGRDAPSKRTDVPAGWTEWFATVGGSTYRMWDYTVNDDGELRDYGSAPDDYQTDVLAAEAEAVVRRRAPDDVPFFMWFSPLAPHAEGGDAAGESGSPRPAPRHTGTFADLPLPQPPSLAEADVSDKPAVLQGRGRLYASQIESITADFRARRESLLAVDEAVERIVSALDDTGELDQTVIVFTSDNGFFLGEHNLRGKVMPYEEAVRVPLLVRGPGFPPGETVSTPLANIDLAPTIMQLAGAEPGRPTDGVSLLDVMADPDAYAGRPLLMEGATGEGEWLFRGVRVPGWTYVEWSTGETELYDLTADPYQLENLDHSGDLSPVVAALRSELVAFLDELRDCAGAECRVAA